MLAANWSILKIIIVFFVQLFEEVTIEDASVFDQTCYHKVENAHESSEYRNKTVHWEIHVEEKKGHEDLKEAFPIEIGQYSEELQNWMVAQLGNE